MDPRRFPETCYRAAGGQCLGETEGYGKHSMAYVAHGRPKRRTIQLIAKVRESWFSYAAQGIRIERFTCPGP